jgi:hypothetical protein
VFRVAQLSPAAVVARVELLAAVLSLGVSGACSAEEEAAAEAASGVGVVVGGLWATVLRRTLGPMVSVQQERALHAAEVAGGGSSDGAVDCKVRLHRISHRLPHPSLLPRRPPCLALLVELQATTLMLRLALFYLRVREHTVSFCPPRSPALSLCPSHKADARWAAVLLEFSPASPQQDTRAAGAAAAWLAPLLQPTLRAAAEAVSFHTGLEGPNLKPLNGPLLRKRNPC